MWVCLCVCVCVCVCEWLPVETPGVLGFIWPVSWRTLVWKRKDPQVSVCVCVCLCVSVCVCVWVAPCGDTWSPGLHLACQLEDSCVKEERSSGVLLLYCGCEVKCWEWHWSSCSLMWWRLVWIRERGILRLVYSSVSGCVDALSTAKEFIGRFAWFSWTNKLLASQTVIKPAVKHLINTYKDL